MPMRGLSGICRPYNNTDVGHGSSNDADKKIVQHQTRFRQIKKRLGVEDCATNVDDHGTPTFDGHSQLSVGGAGSLEPIGALSRKRGRDVAFCGDAGEAPTWPYKTRIIPASGGYCQNAADFQDYGYFAGYSYVPLTAQNYHYPDQMDESLIDPVLRTYSQPHVSQPQHYQADGFRPLTIQQMPMPRPLLDIPQQFIFGNHSNTGELNQQYNYPSP